jgi:hypothetical protein
MKTNVYKASYDDLSESTVNAESLQEAVEELQLVRQDAEPSMVRKIVTGITVPDRPEPRKVEVFVQAKMEDETASVPSSVAVRPTTANIAVGETFRLYAIDTATTPEVDFVGWFIDDTLISDEAVAEYTIPEDQTDPVYIIGKFRPSSVSTKHTLTIMKAMSDGVTPVPASCIASPEDPIELNPDVDIMLFAMVTDPAYAFVAWRTPLGIDISTDSMYLLSMPSEDVTVVAVFEEL